MRAVVTLKSEPLTIYYNGKPFFEPQKIEVKCHLYRVFSLYPGSWFYTEDLYVQTEEGTSISFRPYYLSYVHLGAGVPTELSRMEHIPDYFSIWKHFAFYRGYGFASDAHVRGIEIYGDEVRWRLSLTHHKKCVHLFNIYGFDSLSYTRPYQQIDLFHKIGHCWYEKILKPLRIIPLSPLYT